MIPISSQVDALVSQWQDGHHTGVMNYLGKLPPFSAAAAAILIHARLDEGQKYSFLCQLLEYSGSSLGK